MINWLRWKANLIFSWFSKVSKPPAVWECYFCKHVYDSEHPRVQAYRDGFPIYQCEECRVRLDLENTPTDPKLFDSDG